mmetsp:Transcript_13576/g.53569  ORF Transcript_13576/g.53569 Transcript_13576/m.53569 type:complete len:436 (+) Transcript_13576:19-1326(+)
MSASWPHPSPPLQVMICLAGPLWTGWTESCTKVKLCVVCVLIELLTEKMSGVLPRRALHVVLPRKLSLERRDPPQQLILPPRRRVHHRGTVIPVNVSPAVLGVPACGRHGLLKRLLQVRDEIIGVLDAGADSHEVVGQAASRPHLRGDRRVRHEAWQRDERRGVTERHRDLEQFRLLHHDFAEVHVAGGKGQDTARARGLRLVEAVALVGLQPGVVDVGHRGVSFEPTRHLHRVLLLPLHAQRHGLDAPQRQPAVERAEVQALRVLVEVDVLTELLALDGEDAAGDVGLAADELCRRGHRDVRSQLERLGKHRGHHGVVHAHERTLGVRHLRDPADIGDLQPRVGWRLQHDHRGGPGFDGASHRVQIVHVDVDDFDANLGHNLRQEARGPAVDVVAGDDPLAGLHQPGDAHERAHAGGEGKRSIRALQRGHLLLE